MESFLYLVFLLESFVFTLLDILLSQLRVLIGYLPDNGIISNTLDQLAEGFVHTLVGESAYFSERHSLENVSKYGWLYDPLLCLAVLFVSNTHFLWQVLIFILIASSSRIFKVAHDLNHFAELIKRLLVTSIKYKEKGVEALYFFSFRLLVLCELLVFVCVALLLGLGVEPIRNYQLEVFLHFSGDVVARIFTVKKRMVVWEEVYYLNFNVLGL